MTLLTWMSRETVWETARLGQRRRTLLTIGSKGYSTDLADALTEALSRDNA